MPRPTPSLPAAGVILLALFAGPTLRAEDVGLILAGPDPPAPDVFTATGVFSAAPPSVVTCTTGTPPASVGDGPPGETLTRLAEARPDAGAGQAAGHGVGRRTSSPRWFGGPWVVTEHAYADPNDPDRHTGWGEPLVGTSWRNRPFSVSAFVGGALPNTPVDAALRSRGGTAFGYRLGYDFDHYLGLELRHTVLTTNNVLLGATGADGQAITQAASSQAGDVMVHVYPWGDSRWRPYVGVGLGVGAFDLIDANADRYRETSLIVPLSLGVKYQLWPCLAVRAEVADLIATGGSSLDAENYLNLNIGAEFRFGARPPKYYPFDTARWRW